MPKLVQAPRLVVLVNEGDTIGEDTRLVKTIFALVHHDGTETPLTSGFIHKETTDLLREGLELRVRRIGT